MDRGSLREPALNIVGIKDTHVGKLTEVRPLLCPGGAIAPPPRRQEDESQVGSVRGSLKSLVVVFIGLFLRVRAYAELQPQLAARQERSARRVGATVPPRQCDSLACTSRDVRDTGCSSQQSANELGEPGLCVPRASPLGKLRCVDELRPDGP